MVPSPLKSPSKFIAGTIKISNYLLDYLINLPLEIAALYELYLKHPIVETDTRKLQAGCLFFALKGDRFNGNLFAQQALDAGAAYAVVDEVQNYADERLIFVTDVLETLQALATFHRNQFSIPILGITGSNGKTTTKELITAVLKTQYRTHATVGNLNNHIGVPLTLLRMPLDTEIGIIEMGANHLQEIEGYCKIAQPTHAIITNCGKAHLEGFGSEEGVRKGKGELYDFIREHQGTIYRNSDLAYLEPMANGIDKQITYGQGNATYIGKIISEDVFLKIAVLTSRLEASISTQLTGDFNFPNVMAAIAIGANFQIGIDKIKQAIENYSPDNSRSQLIKQGSNTILLDAYNANPSSMQVAIQNFMNTALPNKCVWIGAMKELGIESANEHQALVNFIQQHPWQQVLFVGNEFKEWKGDALWFENSTEAAAYIAQHLPEHSSILIKGSRGSRMERLLEVLQQG